MNRQLYLFLLICLPTMLAAQSNFDQLFLTSGDTLTGKIVDFSFKAPVQQINFEQSGSARALTLLEIKGLKLKDGRYFSTQIQENQLMEVLVEGAINLYRDTEFFYLKKGSTTMLKLYEVKEKVNVNGRTQLRTRQYWKGSVKQAIYDCIEKPADFVRPFSLSERSLIKVLKAYHECKGAAYIEYGLQLPWTSFNYGLTAGIVNNTIQTEELTVPFSFALDKYQDLGIQAGIFINFGSPRLIRNWSIHAGLLYTAQHFYSNLEEQRGSITEYKELNLRHDILSVPLAIQNRHKLGRTDLNLQLGLQADLYLATHAKVIREELLSNEVNTTVLNDPIKFRSAYYGYLLGLEAVREIAGLRCGLGLRYTGWPHLSNFSDVVIQGNRLSLNAKFYLR
ncbi:MAG: hypothetical protein AAF705_06590 [Bacteroidota bacterium]